MPKSPNARAKRTQKTSPTELFHGALRKAYTLYHVDNVKTLNKAMVMVMQSCDAPMRSRTTFTNRMRALLRCMGNVKHPDMDAFDGCLKRLRDFDKRGPIRIESSEDTAILAKEIADLSPAEQRKKIAERLTARRRTTHDDKNLPAVTFRTVSTYLKESRKAISALPKESRKVIVDTCVCAGV
jgi:hypothetical protein